LKEIANEKTFYIDELAVRTDYRRRRIGSILTNLLIEDASKLGYKVITLRTDVRSGAYLFYQKLGFEDTKIRDPSYPERTYMMKRIR